MTKTDELECEELHSSFYDFKGPTLSDPRYISKALLRVDDRIIAFGNLSILVEAAISFNKDATKREKLHAFCEILKTGIFDAKRQGVDEIIIFTAEKEGLYKTLKNKFGFKDIQGYPLRLRI